MFPDTFRLFTFHELLFIRPSLNRTVTEIDTNYFIVKQYIYIGYYEVEGKVPFWVFNLLATKKASYMGINRNTIERYFCGIL